MKLLTVLLCLALLCNYSSSQEDPPKWVVNLTNTEWSQYQDQIMRYLAKIDNRKMFNPFILRKRDSSNKVKYDNSQYM